MNANICHNKNYVKVSGNSVKNCFDIRPPLRTVKQTRIYTFKHFQKKPILYSGNHLSILPNVR